MESADTPAPRPPTAEPCAPAAADSPRAKDLTFLQELWAFALVVVVVFSGAAWALPPRIARQKELRGLEAELSARVRDLERYARRLDEALAAMQSDPFYRDGAYRKFLGVQRKTEETVDPSPRPDR